MNRRPEKFACKFYQRKQWMKCVEFLASLLDRNNFMNKRNMNLNKTGPGRILGLYHAMKCGVGVGGGGGRDETHKETQNTFSSFSYAILRRFSCFKIICNRPYSSCSSCAEAQTIRLARLFWQLTPQPKREISFFRWLRSLRRR